MITCSSKNIKRDNKDYKALLEKIGEIKKVKHINVFTKENGWFAFEKDKLTYTTSKTTIIGVDEISKKHGSLLIKDKTISEELADFMDLDVLSDMVQWALIRTEAIYGNKKYQI